MRTLARMVVVFCGLACTAALADGTPDPVRTFSRMPKVKGLCKSSPCMVGDPVIVSAFDAIAFDRSEDLAVSMPNGDFRFYRSFVSNGAVLGQVEAVGDGWAPACQVSVLENIAPVFGAQAGNERYLHSLQTLVDTTCPTHTRVLTPDGDVRYFGPVPSLSPGATAWMPRLTGDGAGEPSRLRVLKDATTLTFVWYSEDGESYSYALKGLVYRLVDAKNANGSSLYTVNFSTFGGYVEPTSVALAEAGPSITLRYTVAPVLLLDGLVSAGRDLIRFVGADAIHVEELGGATGQPGGWRDVIGYNSYRESTVPAPVEPSDPVLFAPVQEYRARHTVDLTAWGTKKVVSSREGWSSGSPRVDLYGGGVTSYGARPTTYSDLQDGGATSTTGTST